MIATRSCPHCGREQAASAAFCEACGQEFRSPRFEQETPPPVPSWERRAGLQGRSAVRVMIALLAALAVAVPFLLDGAERTGTWLIVDALLVGVVLGCTVMERGSLVPLLRNSGGIWLLLALPAAYLMQGLGWLWFRALLVLVPETAFAEAFLPQAAWLLLLSAVLVPAIFEELAFRGIFLRSARVFLRPVPAQLLTATAFAAIHFQPLSFPFHFTLGLALGGLRAVSGSLWPPILLHAVNNAIAVGLLPGGPFSS